MLGLPCSLEMAFSPNWAIFGIYVYYINIPHTKIVSAYRTSGVWCCL